MEICGVRSQYTDYHPVSIYAFGKFAKSPLAKLTKGDRLGIACNYYI
ncbi:MULTISPECIES: hypothetical protein [unclassified Nodularia (in: cyanobacteria)]|nr:MULTISPECIES: hypothetical protein [unclassified Nodularia (in: cyanobacteria)]MBE9201797.1 hypothetical protein [Nodularia sp. LEGE 06071]MCC2694431.1 hypothetical protein [Nodularia sp. LEGE 04288]